MARTYLAMTNKVLSRFNEVELTEGTFASSRGIQTQCKNAVNDAILYVNSREFTWPFNHTTVTEACVAGTTRYTVGSTIKHVDYDTFRISKDSSLGTSGGALIKMDYKEYVDKYIEQEDDATVDGAIPTHVFRTPDNNWGLYPYPDKAYEIKYEAYSNTTLLSAYGDETVIPEQFVHVIEDGAASYIYRYRGEHEMFEKSFVMFEKGITQMQSMLMNHDRSLRSYMMVRGAKGDNGFIRTN